MRKKIEECNDYVISNPYSQKEQILNKILSLKYFKNYTANYGLANHKINSNQPVDILSDNTRSNKLPYFYLEYLHIFEIVPKEKMQNLLKEITKFLKKHSDDFMLRNTFDSEPLEFYNEQEIYSDFAEFSINEKSELYNYVSRINFRISTLTTSFCCLDIRIILNKDLKENINQFLIKDVPSKNKFTISRSNRWPFFTKKIISSFGYSVKNDLLEEIITDIKWRVSKEFKKHTQSTILLANQLLPSVTSFNTNIDIDKNSKFWRSVGIDPSQCSKDTNDMLYTCWKEGKSKNLKLFYMKSIDSTYEAFYVEGIIGPYLLTKMVDKEIREQLAKLNYEMDRKTEKNLKDWLKLKVEFSKKIFYYVRYMNECHACIQDSFNNPDGTEEGRSSYFKYYYNQINEQVLNTQKLYNNILDIFQSNIDYRNVEINYKIQRSVLVATFISLVVAILSLYVGIISNGGIFKLLN